MIISPTSAVGDEVVGLSSARRQRRISKVVGTTKKVCFGGAGELGGVVRILVA